MKESIEDTGRKAASTLSQKYQENIAKPLRHWVHHDEESVIPVGHWFDSSRPWTHAVASLGQFRTYPNEYIVYLDMPGVPGEEIEMFGMDTIESNTQDAWYLFIGYRRN